MKGKKEHPYYKEYKRWERSFETYLKSQKRYREKTIISYLGLFFHFFCWIKEEGIIYKEKIGYNDLLSYRNHCREKGNKKSSINQKLSVVGLWLNMLIQRGKRKDNPARDLYFRKVSKRLPSNIIPVKELEETLKNFPIETLADVRDKLLFSLMIYQGIIKAGELESIVTSDVDLTEGKLYIHESAKANTRLLELKASQIIILQQYLGNTRPAILALTGKKTEQLFISLGAGSRLANTLAYCLRKINKLNPLLQSREQIKSSVLADYLKNHNIREAQYFAGHKWVSSTERYKDVTLYDLHEKLQKVHPF